MKKEEVYEIYIDASFDYETKLGTYGIVIKKDDNLMKTISKKCRIKLENSTECETFGIYQAINYIAGTLINKKKIQKFKIITDCTAAISFFITNENKINIFKSEKELSYLMKNIYKRIKRRLLKKNGQLEIIYVERNNNKISHKCAYSALKQIKEQKQLHDKFDYKILFINREIFIKILGDLTKTHYDVIMFFLKNININNTIRITQQDIAADLKIPNSKINKVFKQLIEVGIIEKVKNGEYALLV